MTSATRRIRPWPVLASLLFAGLAEPPLEAAQAEPDGRAGLHLVWFDVSRAAPGAFDAASAEVSSLMDKAGIPVNWRRARSGNLFAHELGVIVLDVRPPRVGLGGDVLGATRRTAGAPRAVWIYLPNILATLRRHLGGRPLALLGDRHVVGRALGRVVVHELVHVLAPDVAHGSGLMAARLGTALLAERRAGLSGGVAHRLRAAVAARAPLSVAQAATAGAAAAGLQ